MPPPPPSSFAMSKRAFVRRCALALLVLGVVSPVLILVSTGGLPRLTPGWPDGGLSERGATDREGGTGRDRQPRDRGGVGRERGGSRGEGWREGWDAARVSDDDEKRGNIMETGVGTDGVPTMSGESDGDAGRAGVATEPRRMDDGRCAALANEWIRDQETRLVERSQEGKSDLLFFLHIPRTAGRTFHFCYLKLAVPESRRCAKSYDELRVNVKDPNCNLLATHDDYSLVERFDQQPRIVTMLRDPVSRFLSSYEFAVEVSVRTFGDDVKKSGKGRVATRDVWPWEYLVRHIDRDLSRYKDVVEKTDMKGSIANVYNNSVYTPLHEFVKLDVAMEDVHNGQFMQLLGITNNANPETEAHAAQLRGCLRKGSVATEALYKFAERRLRDEIDVTVVHERLEESLKFSSAALGFHMQGPGYGGGPAPPMHTKILRAKFNAMKRGGRVTKDAIVVGFIFKFFKVTQEQLNPDEWRESYIIAMKSVMAYTIGVPQEDIFIIPFGPHPQDWSRGQDGFQVAMVQYTPETIADDGLKMAPSELLAFLKARQADAVDLVKAADGFDTYGDLSIHAMGQMHPSVGITIENDGQDARGDTLGEKFRECEASQRAKYARLKTKAFARLHKHVDGSFEPFAKEDRKQIPEALLEEVRERNFLDVRLHEFAKQLFDERLKQKKHEVEMEFLPPKRENPSRHRR